MDSTGQIVPICFQASILRLTWLVSIWIMSRVWLAEGLVMEVWEGGIPRLYIGGNTYDVDAQALGERIAVRASGIENVALGKPADA